MPQFDNKIGTHEFLSMQGQVVFPQERIERIVWPGVDYTRFRRAGTGTDPFRLTTLVNAADENDAYLLISQYKALITGGLQAFVRNSVDYSLTYSLKAQVLDVQETASHAVNQWCNSFDDNDGWLLSAQWTLELKGV